MKKIIKKILSGKVTSNISWIFFQNVYTMILSVIITGIVARHYGTEGYGVINFSLSFVSLFSFIAIFGTNQLIVKDLTNDKYENSVVLGTNFVLRIGLAIISIIVSQLIAFLFHYDKLSLLLILIFNINTIVCCSDIIIYYAQYRLENKSISVSKLISFSIFSVMRIATLWLNLSIEIYAVCYIIESFIYSILLYFDYTKLRKKYAEKKWKFNFEYAKDLLNRSKYFAFSTLMVTIYMRLDQVMIGSYFEAKDLVGIYSAAVRISEIWTFIPLAVITSFKPVIIENYKTQKVLYKENLQKLYNITSIICLIVLIGVCMFGKFGILVLYGDAYLSSYIPLIILTIGTWIGVLGNIHFTWMVCEECEKYSIFYSACGAVTNVILNIILIPKYGMIGAAIATLISQIFSNIISFLFFKNTKVLSIMLIKSLNPISGIKEIMNKTK